MKNTLEIILERKGSLLGGGEEEVINQFLVRYDSFISNP